MLWVGGGILVHGLEELHILEPIPRFIHRVADAAAVGPAAPALQWLAGAIGSAIAGLVIGGAIVLVIRLATKHPEKLITD
jgi:predicted DNA repair protein MutK